MRVIFLVNLLDVFASFHIDSSRFFLKNNISLLDYLTVDHYLFLDSRLTYLISAREEHHQYLMFKIV